jgi:putative sigma-54 modulation protein
MQGAYAGAYQKGRIMKVQVRFKGIEGSDELVHFVTRKVHQHLSGFGHHVRSVMVRLTDVNGPRGGKDKRCQFEIAGPDIGSLHVEGWHEEVCAGVDETLDRVAQTVGRSIARLRDHAVERRPAGSRAMSDAR